MHDDVLEWIMFLNLHADMLYSIIWGDKDTYRLAFHLAGKARGFSQVQELYIFSHLEQTNVLPLQNKNKGKDQKLFQHGKNDF